MSSRNAPPPDDVLLAAVELRIGGCKWEFIAERLHRSAETVRKWPVRYADRWQAAMHRAERRLFVDTQGEAALTLRTLLRDKDSKIRWHAAKSLLGMRLELGKLDLRAGAQTPQAGQINEAQVLRKVLMGYSDEQLEQLALAGFEQAAKLPANPEEATPTSAA